MDNDENIVSHIRYNAAHVHIYVIATKNATILCQEKVSFDKE